MQRIRKIAECKNISTLAPHLISFFKSTLQILVFELDSIPLILLCSSLNLTHFKIISEKTEEHLLIKSERSKVTQARA